MSGDPTIILSDLSLIKRNRILDYLKECEMHFDDACIQKIVDSAEALASGKRTVEMNNRIKEIKDE